MTITAQYTNADETFCNIRLEPGDHLASINVQAETTIPAYKVPAHTVPAFEIDGVSYPARDVEAEDVPEQHIPGGEPMTYSVPCRDDNPVWQAFLARVEAGEVEKPAAYEPPAPGPVVVNKFDFWDRMTEEECEAVEAVVAQQSVKNRRAFETAQTFRSDSPLWGLLNQLADGLFTPERKAIILAAS